VTDSAPGLNYVDRFDPGIRRKAARGGFSYLTPDGKPIKDRATLDRIKALVLPPAWTDVWICTDPKGHIQATGRDAKERLQYRYHADWRTDRDRAKYDRMIDFGQKLPRLREQLSKDLARRGLPRERVLAAVVSLLELTLIRVGNDAYAKENKSFGLTTLRKRHAVLGATGAVFEFKGKSGVKHQTGFKDARLARVVRACGDLPGQRLFQYVDHEGVRHAITSAEVNSYIQSIIGDDFSAKDFRTWNGGLAAAAFLQEAEPVESKAQAERMIRDCIKAVSQRLGNTPAVCRACYIHPAVIDAYRAGTLSKPRAGTNPERRLIRLLKAARSR
jgi:DNA topoisomerase-1